LRFLSLPALAAGLVLAGALPAAASVVRVAPVHNVPIGRGATDLGRAASATPLHVVVGLGVANRAAIDRILVRQAMPGDVLYHTALTPLQARSLISPAGSRVAAVASYLARYGFTNLHVTPDNLLVSGDATVDRASRAFSTEIHVFGSGSQRMLANVRPAIVPVQLRGTIASIQGLHTFAMHAAPIHRAQTRHAMVSKHAVQDCTELLIDACILSEFGPTDFQQVYDASTGSAASTAIAIIAEGELSGVVSDLRQQESLSGIPAVPVTIVETGPQSGDTSGADEFDLDSQYSSGIAENVKQLYLYDAPSLTDADTSTEFDRFVTDDLAKAASASFGECELLAEVDGTPAIDDAIFAEAALQGQTVFASAGDTGTFCPAPVVGQNGVPVGLPGQEYPASSTYVVAVGGTTLLSTAAGAYYGEIGWYSGGGGPSLVETAGSWQAQDATAASLGQRAVPDIAMDADPDTGANVIVSGAAEEIGGTSLSSPLALGVWARLETAHANSLGFASPILYKEFYDEGGTALALPSGIAFTRPIGGFHDVLYGANPLPATPGYDFSTGLGTFDVGLSISDILK
jgi:subtilase family serine protease